MLLAVVKYVNGRTHSERSKLKCVTCQGVQADLSLLSCWGCVS